MDDNFVCLIFAEQVCAGVNYFRLNGRSCLFPHFVSVHSKSGNTVNYFLHSICYSQSLFFLLCEMNETMKQDYHPPTHQTADAFDLLIASIIRDTSNLCF